MPRDITQLLGKELTFEDAEAILRELRDDHISDYWIARQICWKAKVKDIVEFKFNDRDEFEKQEMIRDMANSGETHGWPELEVVSHTRYVKIGAEYCGSSPSGASWVTVKSFQLDDCCMLPADFWKDGDPEFSDITLVTW